MIEIFKKLNIHPSWFDLFLKLFNDPRMDEILKIFEKEQYYPKKSEIFKCFSLNVNDVSVVFLNEEPYRNENSNGLAFGCTKYPEEMIQMLINDVALNYLYDVFYDDAKFDISLNSWKEQGVLLLNSALTIGKSKSHIELWKFFTTEIIKFINDTQENVCFVFFGKTLSYYTLIDIEKNKYLFSLLPLRGGETLRNNFLKQELTCRVNEVIKNPIKWG